MTLPDILTHLLNFVAPALALAVLLPLAARWFRRKAAPLLPWWAQVVVNLVLGLSVQTLCLWYWGRDGKMLGYTALVLALATSQWLLLRGWRR